MGVTIVEPASNWKCRPGSGVPLLYLVYFIGFFCGLTQCFEGVFLPEIKEYFGLKYQQQMYIVFAKNLPFLAALVVAVVVRRFGYKNALSIAMLFYATGTLLLVPGLRVQRYEVVLLGFFIIGTGFTIHMVAGNPLLTSLGSAESASSRLNFGSALGAVAQILAPAALTIIIPVSVIGVQNKVIYIETLFLSLGAALIAVGIATFFFRDVATLSAPETPNSNSPHRWENAIWRNQRVVLGFVALFLILGIEASLFSFFRNYLESPDIAGLTPRTSQRLFTVYFAVFALGRLLASWIQRRILPKTHLQVNLLSATVCLSVMIFSKGTLAVFAFLALGFLASSFFPTLYAVAMDGIGELAPQASGLLTMGFLGCAFIPVVQGAIADLFGLQRSFVLGIVVYLVVAAYCFLILSGKRGEGDFEVERVASFHP